MSKGFLTSHGVIVAALSLSLVGCGQFGQLKASKHFKDANALYAQQDYRNAAVEYKSAIEANPNLNEAYFFLANSYDNLYKPARKGNPLNDSYLQDALRTTRSRPRSWSTTSPRPSCSASARCSSWRRCTPRTS